MALTDAADWVRPQVTESEIVQLTACLRSLEEERPAEESDPADPELEAAMDAVTGHVSELEIQRTLTLPRPDSQTVDELESKTASLQVSRMTRALNMPRQ